MAVVTLNEMKNYLRVDYSDDDTLIADLIHSAENTCLEIFRGDNLDDIDDSVHAKVAVLYTVAYMYEHRDTSDFNEMKLVIRALLSGERKVVF